MYFELDFLAYSLTWFVQLSIFKRFFSEEDTFQTSKTDLRKMTKKSQNILPEYFCTGIETHRRSAHVYTLAQHRAISLTQSN
jgi:hypothetical protein